MTYNPLPDIEFHNDYGNPGLRSPNCPHEIYFFQTKDTLIDVELYRRFILDCANRFRHSRFYKHYKGYLFGLVDNCQFHSNISAEMATIEMHHTILTLKDIILILIENELNTRGYTTTFDIVQKLKDEHRANRIPLTMLSLTVHQIEEEDPEFFIPLSMILTKKWPEFLEDHMLGITQDLAFKIYYYIRRNIENKDRAVDNNLLALRDKIKNWSILNGSSISKYS